MPVVELIVILLILFGALVFFLRKIIYGASVTEGKRLQAFVDENTQREQELKDRLEQAERLYQEKIRAAEDDVTNMKQAGRAEIEQLKTETLEKADAEGKRLVKKAQVVWQKNNEQADERLRQESIVIGQELFRQVLNASGGKLLHDGLLSEIMSEIEGIDPARWPALSGNGELISAYEVDDEYRKKLESVLSEKTGTSISLNTKVGADILAGVIVKLGSLVIDGSLQGRLKTVQASLERSSSHIHER